MRDGQAISGGAGHIELMGQYIVHSRSGPARAAKAARVLVLKRRCTHKEYAAVRWRGRVSNILAIRVRGCTGEDKRTGWRRELGRWSSSPKAQRQVWNGVLPGLVATVRYLIASIRGPSSAALCDMRCEMAILSMRCETCGTDCACETPSCACECRQIDQPAQMAGAIDDHKSTRS